MDYEQMEIDITLESDRDLKENMQATAKFALGQIMEYQHPTKVKNRHGSGILPERNNGGLAQNDKATPKQRQVPVHIGGQFHSTTPADHKAANILRVQLGRFKRRKDRST